MVWIKFFRGLDNFPVNFLKAKTFKTFPGGIYSLIVKNIKLISLILCTVYYFVQQDIYNISIKSTSSFDNNHNTTDLNQSELEISITSEDERIRGEELNRYLIQHYQTVLITQNITHLKIKVLEPFTSNNSGIYYKVLYNEENIGLMTLGIPSITLMSNAAIITFNKTVNNIEIENKTSLGDCIISNNTCDNVMDNFYNNDKILNKQFIFSIYTIQKKHPEKFNSNQMNLTYKYPFYFEESNHDSFLMEQEKVCFLFDNKYMRNNKKTYKFWINWEKPYRYKTQSFFRDYHFNLALGNGANYEMNCYNVSINTLLTILQWYGGSMKLYEIFTVIPPLWYGYYTTLLILKFFKKKGDYELKTNIKNEDNWHRLSYCGWVAMKCGCGKRGKMLKIELEQMKIELKKNYEVLYRSKENALRSRITIDPVDLKELTKK